jgi:recombinational DNA repair protein (RecF pathway)
MRHKYPTRAIVVGRTSLGESHALITLLTVEIGLVRARAQGLRRSGAKLAASLVTYAESDVVLVRGVEGWRLVGASLVTNWHQVLSPAARRRAARTAGLLLRLAPPEGDDAELFTIMQTAFHIWCHEPETVYDAVECLTVLRLLTVLGLDAGTLPTLNEIEQSRAQFVARINRGIGHSGL